MTTKETELLISQWGTDPKPPVLRHPWDRRNDSSAEDRAIRAALRNRPDLGWALAERLAASRRPCGLLKRREYLWIRAARNLLTGGATVAKHLRDVEVVKQARDLHESNEIRPVLNALLMTRDATAQSVADALKIKPVEVMEAYNDLFFNVLDRKDDFAFMRNIMGQGKPDVLFIGRTSLPTPEENLLATGFKGTIDDVLRLAGFATESDDATEDALSSRLSRKILKIAADYLDSPSALQKAPPAIIAHALGMVKKSKVEQTPAFDPGDFAGCCRAVLAKQKKIVEACIAQQADQGGHHP